MKKKRVLCPAHPKYRGIHRPRAECWLCWGAYAKLNRDKLDSEDLARFIMLASKELSFHKDQLGWVSKQCLSRDPWVDNQLEEEGEGDDD